MKRQRRTIPQEIKGLLDQNFADYEDVHERQSNRLQKATSLFNGNKSLGPSICSEIIEQELPALKNYPMVLTDKVVKKAYSGVRASLNQ